ncbi:hypothetical protein [Terrisporobacter sp.]|uniref:hypothetical protein n=1 Tax=Terrisporobacter sp. TaxID=1965305 RepID=UPI002618B446|nr:hypothetical protein [Terrisporobacter sp.]
MTNLEKRLKLANEAKDLIIEFRAEEGRLGENVLEKISISEDGSTIYVTETYDGEKEYALEEISEIFLTEMRGWGPCSAQLEEAISMAQSEVESEYKNMTKEEYIQYVGGLYYMELRCEEIYVRLEQIEKEAEELLG